jgi:hypothetical protein
MMLKWKFRIVVINAPTPGVRLLLATLLAVWAMEWTARTAGNS